MRFWSLSTDENAIQQAARRVAANAVRMKKTDPSAAGRIEMDTSIQPATKAVRRALTSEYAML